MALRTLMHYSLDNLIRYLSVHHSRTVLQPIKVYCIVSQDSTMV